MTIQDFAATLTGREYPFDLNKQEEKTAKDAGFVVVFGSSDDLMEFRGAIHDEVDAYRGHVAAISGGGELLEFADPCADDAEVLSKYGVLNLAKKMLKACKTVEAKWADGEYSWTFETTIPHTTFEIVEDGKKYCRGIVFSVWW